jgi:inhibitor of cysteine peptidase
MAMTLTVTDDRRTVEVSAGSVVTVRLPENATTGYRWTVESAAGLEQVDERFESGGGIGSTGTHELQFRAARVGSFDLRMKHWREWEGERSVDRRFTVKIKVK